MLPRGEHGHDHRGEDEEEEDVGVEEDEEEGELAEEEGGRVEEDGLERRPLLGHYRVDVLSQFVDFAFKLHGSALDHEKRHFEAGDYHHGGAFEHAHYVQLFLKFEIFFTTRCHIALSHPLPHPIQVISILHHYLSHHHHQHPSPQELSRFHIGFFLTHSEE